MGGGCITELMRPLEGMLRRTPLVFSFSGLTDIRLSDPFTEASRFPDNGHKLGSCSPDETRFEGPGARQRRATNFS
jgi:hypothetical protein